MVCKCQLQWENIWLYQPCTVIVSPKNGPNKTSSPGLILSVSWKMHCLLACLGGGNEGGVPPRVADKMHEALQGECHTGSTSTISPFSPCLREDRLLCCLFPRYLPQSPPQGGGRELSLFLQKQIVSNFNLSSEPLGKLFYSNKDNCESVL